MSWWRWGRERLREPRWQAPVLAGLNQGSTMVSSLVAMILLTHLVSPEVYGRYALLLTISLMGMQVTHAGWFQFAMRGWSQPEAHHRAWLGFLVAAGWKRLPVLFVLLGGCLWVWMRATGGVGSWWLLPGLLVVALGWVLYSAGVVMLNAGERNGWVLVMGWWSGLWRALLPVGVAWWAGASVEALLAGLTVAALLSIGGTYYAWHQVYGRAWKVDGERSEAWRREIREFDWAYPVFGIAVWLVESSDRWLVVRHSGEEGGVFALAFSMGMIPFTLAASALHQVFFPRIYRRVVRMADAAEREALVRLCDRILLMYLGLGAVGIGGIALAGPWFMELGWIGRDFHGAWRWLAAAGCAAAFPRILQFHGLLFQGLGRPRALVWIAWGLAIGKVGLCGGALLISEGAFMWALALATLAGALVGRMFLVNRFRVLAAELEAVKG